MKEDEKDQFEDELILAEKSVFLWNAKLGKRKELVNGALRITHVRSCAKP